MCYPKWVTAEILERFDVEEVTKGVWRVKSKKKESEDH